MNKIFKVVWSKTKECYVVVSEVAKNNSGKKKVLASVLAALAVVGAGAAGTPVQAATDYNKKVNISPSGTMAGGYSNTNSVSDNSVVVGYGNTTAGAAGNGHVAYGFGNTATEDSTTAIGGGNKATGGAATAVGSFNQATGRASVAIGNVSIASAEDSIAIGNRANADANNHDADRGSGQFSIAVGRESWAKGTDNISIGHKAETNSTGDSIAMGRESKANQANALAFGAEANASGWGSIATGREAAASANFATAIGYKANASGSNSISVGKENNAKAFDAVAIGHNNTSRTYSAVSLGTDNTSDATYGLTDAQVAALKYDATSIATLTNPEKTDPRRGITSTIAIGRNNVAGNVETIAIGTDTKATMTDAIAIGARAEATGDYALAIGGAAGGKKVSAAGYGTAVGVRANAAERASAFGAGSNAGAQKSVAIGYTANAKEQKDSSTYTYSGTGGAVVGGVNTSTKTIHKGNGTDSTTDIYNSGEEVAIGSGASVSDESNAAVVIGKGAKTEGNAHYSVVVGKGSYANASDGVVVGQDSYVNARESIAIGQTANVSGTGNVRSQAIGFGATVSGTTAYDALALGSGAQVTDVTSGVALGSGSEVSRKTSDTKSIGLNTKYVDGTRVRNRSYEATVTAAGDKWDDGAQLGAVSVGNDNQKRQIINVAAGNQDTDAVNVAQLKNVGVRVGGDTNTATINGQKVAADFLAYNGQLNIKGDNNRVTTVSENDANGKDANVNVKFDYDGLVKSKTGSAVTVDQKTDGNGKTYFEIDAAAGSKTVVADGKNTTVTGAGTTASPYKVNVEGALTGISSITNNGGGKIEFSTGGTTISGGPVNVSNNKITGVADGDVSSTSKDAVNGSQLHAVKTAERHIAPTTTGTEYTVDSNGDVTMTYLDGNNNAVANEKAVIKGIAKQDLSNINDAGKKVITGLGTIVKAGDNVNVSESSDATTGRTTYTVNAVTPAVYTKADGTKVVKRPNGTFTTNLDGSAGNDVDKNDVITSFMDGNGNTTGGNMVINNVGSAIDKTGTSTGNTFLTKLDTAATNTPNAAVNVKDLKTTSDALINKGLNFTGNNTGTENAHKLGSLVKVQGEGVAATDVPTFASAAGNIAVVADGTDTLEIKLNKNLKGINSVSNGSSSITLNSNPGGTNNTPAVQITGGNLSMGNGTTNNKIVNLAPGTNDTDAVNYSQIKGLRTEVKQGANVTVSKTQGTDGHDIYTISAAATGGTASSWNIKSSADTANGGATATGHNANAVNISDQKTVEMVAGKNLTVKQDTTTDGAKVEFALSDNIVAGKDGVNGKDGSVGATGKDGSSVVINGADGSIGMTGPKGQDGKDGINGRDGANISMTSAKGEQVLVNRDPAHSADTDKAERIVYVPKDASGNPIQGADGKNIVREVATMDDGLKFAGDDAQGTDKSKVIAKKLNNTVDIIGGADKDKLTNNNIGVNNDNGKLKVQLAKTIDLTKDGSVTTGNTKVDNSGVTITAPTGGATTNVTLTQSGLDNGGNKITNVKAGTDNTDAVNVKQLKDTEKHIKPGSYAVQSDGSVTLNYQDGNNNDLTETAKITGIAKQDLSNIDNAGKKVITGLGSIVEAGDNVTVTSTENATTGQKTYTVNAVTPAVYTTPSGEKLTKKSDGKFYKADGSEYTGGDIIASFENPNANSIPAGKNSTTDGGMIVNNIGSAIKNQNPTMPAGQTATYLDKLKAAADAGSNVKNAAVNVSDLHNTAEALKSNELHIRPTTTNRTDETVNQNAGGTAESYKYDSTTKSVTLKYNDGTGAGVTGTEAKIDLSDLANQITSGYTFKTNATENGGKVVNDAATPAAETAVANGGVVNYAAGKNLTVKQDIEKDGTGAATGKQTYTYALADEIGIGEKGQPGVAGKDGVDGKIGVNGKDGSSVVINGKDGSIGMTGPQGQNGKDGINGRDGANISMTSAKGEQVLVNRDPAHNADNDKAERIVYVPKDASGNPIQDANGKNIVREVATMDDGLKFTGNNESTVNNNKLNTLVKVQGEGTKEDTNAAGAKEIQTSDGTKFESAKDNIAVVADGTNTLTVKLNKKLKGLDSVQTKTVELGDHTTPGGTTNITYNSGDKRIEYTTPGATGTPETKKVATTDDIWTIQGNGTDVAPVNGKVNVKAGENILITTPATADGSMTINAVTPAVYTDKDGNKLTKDKDGKFHKSDGTEVAATDVITSIQDAAGNTTGGNSIVNNVGSAINNHATPGVTSPTYLDKLDAAAGDTKTQNAAVNVTDLKNTADGLTDKGLNFTGNNESTVNKHKLGSLVKVQGEGTKEGTNAAGTKEIQTSDGTKFESAKDNIAVEANNGDTLTVKLNKNLKGLNSVQTKNVELGDHTTPGGTTNITYNSGDKRIEYTTPGATGTPETKKVATTDDIWTIQGNGTDVAPVNGKVNVKAGENILITTPTTADGSMTINAVTPAIYTDKNGNKVVKRPDGTYTTNLDGSAGNDVAANDVIISFKDAAGNTTGGNSIINNVGSAIKNQTPTMPAGQTATYLDKLKAAADDTKTQNAAVNVSDLHNTANALKNSELHIAPTAVKSGSTEAKGGAASGNTIPGAATQAYKYNATTKQVELTFNDGNGNAVADTKAVIDLSNLPTGGDMSSFHVTSSAESTTVGTHAGDTTQEIKDGKSIDFQAGKNMTVKQTNDSNGNTTINYALDKDLDVESVHVGKDGKDGKIGIDGKDGVDGLNGTNRVDIHVEKGAKGVDGTDGHDGVNGHNGKDGMTRIVYEDKGGKQEVATLNDGLKFTGNNESTVNNNKLNTLVKVQGEGTKEGTNAAGAKEIQTSDGTKFESAKDNIAVVADGTDTLTVKLNKNLKGLDSVQTKTVVLGNPDVANGTTNITYNPTDKRIEYVTPDAAGTGTTTNKVANLDDEKHIKAGSYAVQNDGSVTMTYVDGNNKDVPNDKAIITGIAKQNLSNIDNAGKTVITGLGTIVKAGDNVTVSEAADATTGQKTYTVNAVTPAIYTDKNGNKVVKRPDGTYTTNLDGSTGNDVAANDVIVSFKDAAGNTTGGNAIINNVGSAIKNQTPTMPAGATATYLDKLKAAADDTKTQNAAVNVSDLHNTANALKDSELHIAPTAVKSGSTEVKGGVASGNTNPGAAAQAYKYNATTKQVELTFNDGNGNAVADTKEVIDLSELAGSIKNYGFKTNAAGNLETGTNATATAVASGKTVTYAAGKNLTVKQEIGTDDNQTYTYALNKDLTNLDKVVVNGKDGQPGKDGVTIIGPQGATGTPGTNGIDGKVGISGKDGKDAVSISGKDGVGHIGLTGPQGPQGPAGTPGTPGANIDISTDHGTQTLVKPEANNDNKSERIVYVPKDKDGNPLKDTDGNVIKREVATMDDGLKFAGDDGTVIKKALGTQLDIIGGADSTKLTDNNIGVNNDGHGKLKVQLAKNIDLTKDGSVTTGNTKVNNDGITITKPATATDPAKTVSLTGDGLNNGGNKITNVKAGEDPTDAVNVQQLNDKVTTVKSSDNTISVKDTNLDNAGNVIDKTKGHQYDITINNQGVVNKAQTPVVYTKEDGTKVYLVNGKFYDNPEGNGAEVPKAQVIASMNNADNSSTTPMKLNNVGSSIANETGATFLDKLDSANTNTPNGAVNVSDLKSTADDLINKGLKFDANSGGVKTNKLGSTVKVQGAGTKADNEYSGENIKTIIGQDNAGNTTIDVKLDKNLKSETITVTGKDGKDGKIGINGKNGTNGVDGTNRVDIQVEKGVDGIGGKNGTDGISRIVYEDKAGKHTVATTEDGLAFKGDNATVVKKKLGEQLDIIGGADSTKLTDNNIGVNADNDGKLKVQLAKDVNLSDTGSIKFGDTANDNTVINKGGITITKPAAGTDPAKTVSLTGDGLNNGGNKITNVKAGEDPTDAVNVQQLNDKVTTVKSSDNTISVKDTNLDNAGHVIDKTKGHQYDITINSQGVVNKAQTPVVYTKEDGTKVYLVNNKFYDNPQGNGAEVPKAQVIASMNNADGSTTTPMKLNNVGSSIQKPNSTDTFLKQLDDANKSTPNGAVNVSDLKKTSDALIDKGLVFDANNKDPKTNKLGSKVTIAGTGALANGENFADKYNTDNIRTNITQNPTTGNTTVEIGLNKNLKGLESVSVPGKDGVDGRDGVSITGKDGANGVDGKVGIAGKDGKDAVSISGKDGIGHIGLTGPAGKDGKDATADITVKEGKAGVDGKDGVDGITRIVYNDKNGNEHQVATHDDGLKFTGNNESTVNKHHLNSLVKIQGEGVTEAQSTSFQSAAGNINVKANGTDTLEIQLNKDLKGINSIRNSANGPVMNFNAGDIAISGGNLSMGDGTHNNKIVNLAAGTNDTDAVNYKQLKDSRTTVTSQDGSVTITPTPNGDSMNYDLKVNPPLDPRVDQLAEEVGRVGAQGAALSALKPIQYDPLEPTQIMAGYGNYRGNSAIAMGVAHYKNESTLIHGGISWAGGSSHMMANAGVTWKVGNRDSEAAVADRYRKGPISSAYAMQQEMAAMKAQNAGLKGEVSDLKAENEQMKAQIAAMMAKLGL